MAFSRTRADRLPILSIAATGTHKQALQQITRSSLSNTSALLVFLQLVLHCLKQGFVNQRRDRNAHPFFTRDIVGGNGSFGLHRTTSLPSQPWSKGFDTGFAEGSSSLVRRIFEHVTDGGTIPHRFASSRFLFGCIQATAHLPNRAAIVSHPAKHLTHDACFLKQHIKTCLPISIMRGSHSDSHRVLHGSTLTDPP